MWSYLRVFERTRAAAFCVRCYEWIISSSSSGKPKHSAVIDVPIIVRNKAMPIFQEHYYSAVIDEDITLHSAVIQVQAISPHGRDVIYSLFSGDEYNQFDINPNEGKLIA